jgi:predicted enzyme related to lactoylglutathione lyase
MTTMRPVVHFEMPAEDRDRMTAFYETVFGWKTQKLGPDMGNYVVVTTAESDAKPGAPAGAINGGFFPRKPDWPAQYPSVVIAVEDIDLAMREVGQAGGKVLGEPLEIPGIGRYVSFTDTEGNRVSMLQPAAA